MKVKNDSTEFDKIELNKEGYLFSDMKPNANTENIDRKEVDLRPTLY
jgi:hypothetical protein